MGLAERGWQVQFVETTGKRIPPPLEILNRWGRKTGVERPIPEGITVHKRQIIPPAWGWMRQVNRSEIKRFANEINLQAGGVVDAVVVHLPTWTSLDLMREISPKKTLYDSASLFKELKGTIPTLDEAEKEICRTVEKVWADGPFLAKHCKKQGAKKVSVVGPGVHFRRWCGMEQGRTPIKTVGYFGMVRREDLNLSVLRGLPKHGIGVRVVGPDPEGLLRGSDVRWEPPVSPKDLPRALAGVDALILPYKGTRFTDGIVPAKTMECLASGLPVFVTGLSSLIDNPAFIPIEGGVRKVANAIKGHNESDKKRASRWEIAKENDWSQKVNLLEAALST